MKMRCYPLLLGATQRHKYFEKWRDKQKEENEKKELDKLDSILKEIKDDAERSTNNAVHD